MRASNQSNDPMHHDMTASANHYIVPRPDPAQTRLECILSTQRNPLDAGKPLLRSKRWRHPPFLTLPRITRHWPLCEARSARQNYILGTNIKCTVTWPLKGGEALKRGKETCLLHNPAAQLVSHAHASPALCDCTVRARARSKACQSGLLWIAAYECCSNCKA